MTPPKGPKPRIGTVAMVARCRDCGGELRAALVHRERMTVTITGWSHVDELVTCPPGAAACAMYCGLWAAEGDTLCPGCRSSLSRAGG